MPPIFDVDDIGATDMYKEWWVVAQPTHVFSIDELLDYARPFPNQKDEEEDRVEETRVRVAKLFTNMIDEDYDEAADLHYDGQQEDEEDQLMSEVDDIMDEDLVVYEWRELAPTRVTRAQSVAHTNTYNHGEVSTFSMPHT